MNRLADMAFDAADAYCQCKEGEYCEAHAFMNGFIEGFKVARAGAAELAGNVSATLKEDVEKLGEGPAK